MPQKIEAEEAITVLQDAMISAEAITERKTQLAQYASDIIRKKGELLIARNGYFGGSPDLIGSADQGVLLMQATKPVLLGDVYVALRDKDEERSGKVELIFAGSEDDDQVGKDDGGGIEVAATLSNSALNIPNTEKPSRAEIDSVASVLGHIDHTLEPLPTDGLHLQLSRKFPRIEARNFNMEDGVHRMEEISKAQQRQDDVLLKDLGFNTT